MADRSVLPPKLHRAHRYVRVVTYHVPSSQLDRLEDPPEVEHVRVAEEDEPHASVLTDVALGLPLDDRVVCIDCELPLEHARHRPCAAEAREQRGRQANGRRR